MMRSLKFLAIGFGIAGWLREPVFFLSPVQRIVMALLIAWTAYITMTGIKNPRRTTGE